MGTPAEVTYANLVSQAQTDVWALVSNDSNVQKYTKTILDKQPRGLTKPIGLPFVIVPLPHIHEERLTMSQKRLFLTFDVEVWFKLVVNAPLVDAVRSALSAASGTPFSQTYAIHQFLGHGTPRYVDWPDEGGSVQQVTAFTITVIYEWVGVPS